jgi:DNA modification methylase
MPTARREICYGPFSGRGSQLVAGQQTGRRCYAIRKSPAFVGDALERLAALGVRPELER